MALYSNDPKLDKFIEKVYEKLLYSGMEINPESFKEINYGVSLKATPKGEKKQVSISIYHTEKKGFSVVVKNPEIKGTIMSLLTEEGVGGSDEAGKGDVFGPLVFTSFIVSDPAILKMNIKDSKNMKNDEVLAVTEELQKKFSSSFVTVKIMPERYNSFYEDLKKNGKNLNHMMAWGHGKAISLLKEKQKCLKKVIVDQFSSSSTILNSIRRSAEGVNLDFQVRGESNFPVAAASVVARGEYLRSLEHISSQVLDNKVKLLSGSGDRSDAVLQEIVSLFDKNVLSKICKKHFANISKLYFQRV